MSLTKSPCSPWHVYYSLGNKVVEYPINFRWADNTNRSLESNILVFDPE